MSLKDLLYSKQKLDQFENDIKAAEALTDPAERLLRLDDLSQERISEMWKKTTTRLMVGSLVVATVSLCGAMPLLAGLGMAAGWGMLATGFGATAIIWAALLVEGFSSGRVDALRKSVFETKDREEKNATLDRLAVSPQLDSVLQAYPGLKDRFGDEAIRKVAASSQPVVAPAAPGL